MRLSQDFLMDLKSRNDIESVVSRYVTLRRRGNRLNGLCPFHNEKTPSFYVSPEKGVYHCFGCGVGGDVITFMMQIENLDYMDAVGRLAESAGLMMPTEAIDDREFKLKNDIYEANREAAKFFHEKLYTDEGKAGLEYLTNRGLSHKTIKRFGLGFAPDSWDSLIKHLRAKGFSDYVMSQADLVATSKKGGYYDRFRNRVIFPIINIRGKVVAFGARALPGAVDEKGMKYINTSETPVFKKRQNMYAMNYAKECCSERIILAEGYMDVIALHQAGFCNAVATSGTAFTEEQARMLARYTKELVLTFDADNAGKKATDRALEILRNTGLQSRILRIPNGKDPDEFLKNNSAAKFEALLNGAVNDTEYKLFLATDGLDMDTDDGRLIYLRRAAEILSSIDDRIEKDLYAGRLADKYNVSKNAIMTQIDMLTGEKKKRTVKNELNEIIHPKRKYKVNLQRDKYLRASKAEEKVLNLLMLHPDFLAVAEKKLCGSMVTDFNTKVYAALVDILGNGQAFDMVLLGDEFTIEEKGVISSYIASDRPEVNPKQTLMDCLEVVVEEKSKKDRAPVSDLTDDEWAKQMQEMIKNKAKTSNGG